LIQKNAQNSEYEKSFKIDLSKVLRRHHGTYAAVPPARGSVSPASSKD
jgi:hypothetical protein